MNEKLKKKKKKKMPASENRERPETQVIEQQVPNRRQGAYEEINE